MKAIQTGLKFKIYDDGMIIHDQLPVQAYQVNFDQFQGPFLSKYSDIEVNEKIYGVHLAKVEKVLSAYSAFERSLGIILSGDKGIGKSLFSKLLAIEGIKRGLPLLIVSSYFPGIADYIASIEQEVIVMFDEFDKTFSERDMGGTAQAEMLTLFDGLAQGKKMYVITCNKIAGLNDYLVNRPGRFHYHFRFQYPTANEIREYLTDKLAEEYYKEIEKVVSFAGKVDTNYDCLRAIAFELNTGLSFEDAILDLNIVNVQREYFNLVLHFPSGARLKLKKIALDLFSPDEMNLSFEDPDEYYTIGQLTFIPSDATWFNELGGNAILAKNFKWESEDWLKCKLQKEAARVEDPEKLNKYIEEEGEDADPLYYTHRFEPYKEAPTHLSIHRVMEKGIHYAL